MKYETYRRVRITSPRLVMLYYGLVACVVAFVLPLLIATGHDHLALQAPHPVRFIATVRANESLADRAGRMRECRALAAQRKCAGGCVFLDYLEIVEADGDSMFITTHVQETAQSRPVVAASTRPPAAAARTIADDGAAAALDDDDSVPHDWQRDAPTSSTPQAGGSGGGGDGGDGGDYSFITLSPERTAVRVEHRLKNDGVSVRDMRGFMLSAAECDAMDAGRTQQVVDALLREAGDHGDSRSGRAGQRVTFHGGNDVMRVSDLLDAANVTIDQVRFSGAHLDVSIYYSNLHGSLAPYAASDRSALGEALVRLGIAPGDGLYAYCVEAVLPHDARFFYSARVADADAGGAQRPRATEHRLIKTHFGVRAKFRVTGSLGQLSLSAFARFLAGSLTLLTVPYTITELVLSFAPSVLAAVPSWWGNFVLEQ